MLGVGVVGRVCPRHFSEGQFLVTSEKTDMGPLRIRKEVGEDFVD